jgi:ferritin-like metal-binding protein YciE
MTTQTKKNKKIKTAGATDLRTVFAVQLAFLLDMESQLVKALPAAAKKATHVDLREILENHAAETRDHAGRLAKIFAVLEIKPQKVQSQAIRGLIADIEWIAKNLKSYGARDAALLAAVQCIEQYEIAAYRSTIEWATLLKEADVADLLHQTLDEEAEADETLGDLAESTINEVALGEEDDDKEIEDNDEGDDDEDEEE